MSELCKELDILRNKTTSPKLRSIGVKEIADVIEQGNLKLDIFIKSNLDERIQMDEPIKSGASTSFGKLDAKSIILLDEKVKIMIASVVRNLEKLSSTFYQEFSWTNINEIFSQNSLLEYVQTPQIQRVEKLNKEFDQELEKKDIEKFLIGLGIDQEVIADAQIDSNTFQKIVDAIKIVASDFNSYSTHKEYYEREIVNIVVLRFPDSDNLYLKLYHIQIGCWNDSTGNIFVKNQHGVTVTYTTAVYQPRESVILELRQQAKINAIQIAESLFDELPASLV